MTSTREPTANVGALAAPECSDCASVVKNSLSLSAVLVVVPAAGVVVVSAGVAVPVEVAGGCSRFKTLLKAATRRVKRRFGAGAAASVLGTVLVVAGVAGVCVVGLTDGVAVVLAVVVLTLAAGAVPNDCASCAKRCAKPS